MNAYINGLNVIIYDFQGDYCKCFVPEVGITDWFNKNLIEVRCD